MLHCKYTESMFCNFIYNVPLSDKLARNEMYHFAYLCQSFQELDMSGKTYIVYDIETAGMPIDSFDEARQDYLLRGASTDE